VILVVNRLLPVLAFTFAMLAVRLVARRLGAEGDRLLLSALVVLAAAVAVGLSRVRSRVRRRFRALDAEAQRAALRATPQLINVVAGDVYGNERLDYVWALNSALGGLASLLYLPVLYTIATTGTLSRHSEVTATHVALMLAGMATFRPYSRYRLRTYVCPACHTAPECVSSDPVRFHCKACDTTWLLRG
jgi:hypothetical protein